MKAERLQSWLKKVPARVKLLRLTHGDLDSSEEVLGEWDRPEGAGIPTMAESVIEYAQQHCDEIQQSCRYRFTGFDKDDKSILVTTLRQQPEGEVAFEGMRNVEEASASGVTAQALRHTEVITQMFTRAIGQILHVQASQVEQLQRTVTILQKRDVETMDLARAMATTTEDAITKERNSDRWDKLAEIVTEKVGPAVLKEMGMLPADFGKVAEVVKIVAGEDKKE